MNKFGLRTSKFRHIFGQPYKREQCYDEIKVTKSSWDAPYCCVNPKFLAVITEAVGGGAFLVLPLSKTGRTDRAAPRVTGHKDAVLDIAWSPFNDNLIASASTDCSIKLWEIPDDGLKEDLTEPKITLSGHQRKVGLVVWHPTANDILCSGGADGKIILWDSGSGEMFIDIDLEQIVFCISFNYNGSRLATTTKDKSLRVIDAHTGEILKTGKPHDAAKGSQVLYLKNGKVLTTGFSRESERQVAIFDENDLEKPLNVMNIDNNNGVMFPFYDVDNNVVYLCGKGDCYIRFYEVTDDSPYIHFLNMYTSNTSMRGFGFMPKRGLNIHSNEIARIYKLLNTGLCEVIPFTVPRKSELLQKDLYPLTASTEPALEAEEWMEGKDADPILMSLCGEEVTQEKPKAKVIRRTDKPHTPTTKATENAKTTPTTAAGEPAPTLPTHEDNITEGFDAQALMEDTRKLKLIVKAHERRIKSLEEKIAMYEQATSEEEEEAADA